MDHTWIRKIIQNYRIAQQLFNYYRSVRTDSIGFFTESNQTKTYFLERSEKRDEDEENSQLRTRADDFNISFSKRESFIISPCEWNFPVFLACLLLSSITSKQKKFVASDKIAFYVDCFRTFKSQTSEICREKNGRKKYLRRSVTLCAMSHRGSADEGIQK